MKQCVLALVFLWLPSLFAETAGVSGVVQDSTAAVVPGAVVVLLTQEHQRVVAAQTSARGTFRLSVPKPGDYLLEISYPGFKNFTTAVRVALGTNQPITAVLEVADKAERMDVSAGSEAAAVSTDPAENRDAASLDENTLEKLPVFDQDYIGTMSSFLDQGSVGTLGTTIVVDGIEQKDAGVTPSAIQDVKINNDPYSAEYSRPGRGRIEITTKAAASVFHGTFNFILRDYHFNARNPFATTRPPEQRRVFEGYLTGPIGTSKKTSFLISLDHRQDNVQSIVVAQLPSGLLRENVPTPLHATDGAGRISHDFSDNHTGSLQFTYEDTSGQDQLSSSQNQGPTAAGRSAGNNNQTLGGYVLPQAGTNYDSLERHLIYTDRLVFTPNLLNQFQVMYERNRDVTTNVTSAPQINVQGAFTAGGANAAQLATENNLNIKDVVSWSHGAHTIKAGIAMPNMSRRALDDLTNRQGTFSFASLQDYVNGNPYSFTEQQGQVRFLFWEKEVGGFVQDQIRVTSNLQVAFGMRWDWQNYLRDDNNFSPRLAVAYAFGGDRKTVLRAGSGIFYDRTGARPMSNLVRYSAPAEQNLLIVDPSYPNPFLNNSSLAAQAPDVYRFSPTIRTPYSIQYSAGLERQVFGTATVAATYRGSIGVSLFRSLDVNQPLPPLYLNRPDPGYGVYQEVEASGRQISNALDLSVSGKLSRYITALAQYSLSRTNNNTGGINYIPPNSYDLSGEYARADFDQRNRFTMLLSSTLNKWVNLGIGFTAASGLPYTELSGQDSFHTGLATARPPGVPRNSLQGPGFAELDLRWSHDFWFSAKGEKGPLATLAIDAFNVTNKVNASQYVGNEQSPFFGQAVSALPPRRLQATVRFKF